MSEYSNIIIKTQDGIATISINRPKSLNSLNRQTLLELQDALAAAIKNDAVNVIILTGTGEKSFIAGTDLSEMKDYPIDEAYLNAKIGTDIVSMMQDTVKPVIAAVNGYALGGGCELAAACDIRIASENAVFGQPETGVGITPGYGGTQLLSRLVGMGMAKYMIFSGKQVKAQEAKEIGLVQEVVPLSELQDFVQTLAKTIMKKSLHAVGLSKLVINGGADGDIKRGFELENMAFTNCFSHPDQKEGMTAFVEKRLPEFQG